MQEISHYWFKWGNSFSEWTLDSELALINVCGFIGNEKLWFLNYPITSWSFWEKSRNLILCSDLFYFWAKCNFFYSIWKLDGVPWFFIGTHKHELVLFIGDHSSLKPTMNKTYSFAILGGIQKPCGPILTPPPPSWTVLLNRLF